MHCRYTLSVIQVDVEMPPVRGEGVVYEALIMDTSYLSMFYRYTC